MHGEARRKTSLVLSHDEYGRLISKMVSYNKYRGNDFEEKRDLITFESWIDYMIVGNVYIIGCGFDFSEFDLWWLLSRRQRETAAKGRVVFYEPKSSDTNYKHNALCDLGVDVESFDMTVPDDDGNKKAKFFNQFYHKAVLDIDKKINQNKKEEKEHGTDSRCN